MKRPEVAEWTQALDLHKIDGEVLRALALGSFMLR